MRHAVQPKPDATYGQKCAASCGPSRWGEGRECEGVVAEYERHRGRGVVEATIEGESHFNGSDSIAAAVGGVNRWRSEADDAMRRGS